MKFPRFVATGAVVSLVSLLTLVGGHAPAGAATVGSGNCESTVCHTKVGTRAAGRRRDSLDNRE